MKINISDKDKKILEKLNKQGSRKAKRSAKVLETLLFDNNFKKLVKRVRREKNIPEKGFSDRGSGRELEISHFIKGYLANSNLKGSFYESRKYTKDGVKNLISQYIKFGDIEVKTKDYDIGMIQSDKWQGNDDFAREIIIYLDPKATKRQVIDFVKNNWDQFKKNKEYLLGKDGSNSKLRPSKKFSRNVFIFNKYEELKSIPKDKRGFKYISLEIKKILKKKDEDISEGTIKHTVSKMRKKYKRANDKSMDFSEIDFDSYKSKEVKVPESGEPIF